MRARWSRYWFGADGRYSAAVARIAVALSLLILLHAIRHYGVAPPAPTGPYRPIGVLLLLPFEPSSLVVKAMWWAALVAGIALLVGVATRLASIVALAAGLVLGGMFYAYRDHWSHEFNATLLGLLILVGAPTADVWSIDAWRRARRGEAPPPPRPSIWVGRLVMLTVGLMMASAGFSKLLSGGMSLDWALSDNLRHQILVRFDLGGVPRTALASWILEEPWRWKLAALGNLGAQLAPLVAAFVIRRPWVRAACGLVFATEVAALWFVMGFWDPWWYPLALVFIDGDRVVGWWRARRGSADAAVGVVPAAVAPGVPPAHLHTRVLVALYVTVSVVIGFWHWPLLDQRLRLHPFSAFPMFASIRAVPPYDQHLPYELLEGQVAVVAAPTATAAEASALATWAAGRGDARALVRARTPARIEAALRALRAEAPAGLAEVSLELRARRAAPHPAPARFVLDAVATFGTIDAAGHITHRLGRLGRGGGTWVIRDIPAAPALAWYANGALTPLMPGSAADDVAVALPRGPGLVLARVAARWFVVADKRR